MSTPAESADNSDAADAAAARSRTDEAAGPDSDGDRIYRAAAELLKRGRDGAGMTEATARYRQLELAQLLHTIARAVQVGTPLPHELVRHAANLSRHVLNYPAAQPPVHPSARPDDRPLPGAPAAHGEP